MSNTWGFNQIDADTLKEIANIGSGTAAGSLASLLKDKITMTVPEVTTPEFKDLPDILNGADKVVASVFVKIYGDIKGTMMYVMDENSACTLTNRILNKKNRSLYDFGEMELSVITEIGNILTSSYLMSMSSLLKFNITKSVPYLAIDMAGAVLSVPATEFAKVADSVLLIKSTLKDNTYNMFGFFILIPDFGEI
ncbi:MAG: CheY-P-specific phosphatase CheC [Clostridiales bacterium]|jgi:chemotaxis protein CheC|nr:CheY-P-specific phosphatase CheC [Clostridiales bacterium]